MFSSNPVDLMFYVHDNPESFEEMLISRPMEEIVDYASLLMLLSEDDDSYFIKSENEDRFLFYSAKDDFGAPEHKRNMNVNGGWKEMQEGLEELSKRYMDEQLAMYDDYGFTC
jgi:hypothetical protein